MTRCGLIGFAIVLATIAAGAQARWEIDATTSNASVEGFGGGFIYSCATDAPSLGAVAVEVRGLRADGFVYGTIDAGEAGTVLTEWLCTPSDSFSMCVVATVNDVARIRDLLIRGSRASVTLVGQTVEATLRGSTRAIERVQARCLRTFFIRPRR